VTVWLARSFATSADRYPLSAFPLTSSTRTTGKCTNGSQSKKVVHGMAVLRHTLAMLCEMLLITSIMTEEDPLHGLYSHQIRILWIFTCGGHLKHLTYVAPVGNEEAFHHLIVIACQTIRNYSGISEWMQGSMMRRVEACIESHTEKTF
jgi:hypothetical protein